jgi:multidrug efflux pump subunit AcrB
MAINLLADEKDGEGLGRGRLARYQKGFERGFDRFKERYRGWLTTALENRALVLIAVAVIIGGSLLLMGGVGEDYFPYVDSGQIKLHARVPPGIRLEESERMMAQIEDIIRSVIPKKEFVLMTDHIGIPIYWALLFYQTDTLGPQDADIQVQLTPKHHPSLDYIDLIRKEVTARMPGVSIYAQAADITSQVLNFGLSAPIDVQIQGKDVDSSFKIATRLQSQIRTIPGAVDVRIPQVFGYPTIKVDIDRAKALQLGITASQMADNILDSLASSLVISPNNWLDWSNGVNYSVAVQTPQHVVNSIAEVLKTPVNPLVPDPEPSPSDGPATQYVSNIATFTHMTTPLGVTHHNVLRVVDVNCGVERRDLGGVTADVQAYINQVKDAPAGTVISVLGQSDAMHQAFGSMGRGLILAMILVYFMMAINYQSWLDPMLIMMALPGAFAGVLWMLVITHTTINVESLMGSIMAVGVATTNGNLLITFANEFMEKEHSDAVTAAIEAGVTRLRPVLMTALAMILGMLPMATSAGQNAPLGRAVIGGLIAATFMTLLVIPLVFSLFSSARVSTLQRDAEVRRLWAQTEASKELEM